MSIKWGTVMVVRGELPELTESESERIKAAMRDAMRQAYEHMGQQIAQAVLTGFAPSPVSVAQPPQIEAPTIDAEYEVKSGVL